VFARSTTGGWFSFRSVDSSSDDDDKDDKDDDDDDDGELLCRPPQSHNVSFFSSVKDAP
jgi:hypothetical protein